MANDTGGSIFALVIVLLIFGALSVGGMMLKGSMGYYDEEHVTGKVLKMERVVKDDTSYYLVYCDVEVFTIQDDFYKGRFNSSDLYRDIEVGKTYNFTVFGWRNGFFSWYRNILRAEEVTA